MRTIEEVVSELASELIRFLNEPKDQKGRVKANLDHLKCGKYLKEIVEIHKAEKEDVLDKIRAEIEKQEKWLLQAGYNTYNVDIAFNSIKLALTESEGKE